MNSNCFNDENDVVKKPMKRKSSTILEKVISPKRIINDENSEINNITFDSVNNSNISEISFSNPVSIVSTCLTNNLKKNCNINHLRKSVGHPTTCSTPSEHVLPFEDFKKLPKPPNELADLIENMFLNNDKKVLLNRSISETAVQLFKNITNDDSFLNTNVTNLPKETPVACAFQPTFLTPETPNDWHSFDSNSQELPFQFTMKDLNPINPHINLKRDLYMSNLSPMNFKIQSQEIEMQFKPKSTAPRFTENSSISPKELDYIEELNKIEEIGIEKVVEIINDDFTTDSHAYYIFDCRYPYEYQGGHIIGAQNIYTLWQLLNFVFLGNCKDDFLQQLPENDEESLSKLINHIKAMKRPACKWKGQAFIFHCEFSSVRAPKMARCMRNMDRILNVDSYPDLFYPKVYVMKGGYNAFFNKFSSMCHPQAYVPMFTEDDVEDLNSEEFENNTEENCESNENCVINDETKKESNKLCDDETNAEQMRMYNVCKRKSLDQMEIFSNLTKNL